MLPLKIFKKWCNLVHLNFNVNIAWKYLYLEQQLQKKVASFLEDDGGMLPSENFGKNGAIWFILKLKRYF